MHIARKSTNFHNIVILIVEKVQIKAEWKTNAKNSIYSTFWNLSNTKIRIKKSHMAVETSKFKYFEKFSAKIDIFLFKYIEKRIVVKRAN